MEWMKTAGDKTGLETLTMKSKEEAKENFEAGTGNHIPNPQRQQEETVKIKKCKVVPVPNKLSTTP
jgi:hypothetical protein